MASAVNRTSAIARVNARRTNGSRGGSSAARVASALTPSSYRATAATRPGGRGRGRLLQDRARLSPVKIGWTPATLGPGMLDFLPEPDRQRSGRGRYRETPHQTAQRRRADNIIRGPDHGGGHQD